MSERRDAIVRLLELRAEGLPEPPRRRIEGTSGFVHGRGADGQQLRWLSCPDCLANDRTMFGCETCGGRGQIPDVGRDPYAVNETVAYGLDGSRHDWSHERDRQIEMLGRQLRQAADVDEVEDANQHPYAWERARRRLYQTYDLAAVDRAVERFHLAFPGRSVYSDLGLTFLDEQLPDPLRAPAAPKPQPTVTGPIRPEAGASTKQVRDAELRARALDGASPAELAAEFRVSLRTVYQAVRDANQEAA